MADQVQMQMAKATPADVEATMTVASIIEGLHKGWYPSDDENAPNFFDPDDQEHLRYLYDKLIEITQPVGGGLFRVAGGMHVILTNDILNPDLDHLALHPRFLEANTNG